MSYYPAAHWATKPTELWRDVQQETRGFFWSKKGEYFEDFVLNHTWQVLQGFLRDVGDMLLSRTQELESYWNKSKTGPSKLCRFCIFILELFRVIQMPPTPFGQSRMPSYSWKLSSWDTVHSLERSTPSRIEEHPGAVTKAIIGKSLLCQLQLALTSASAGNHCCSVLVSIGQYWVNTVGHGQCWSVLGEYWSVLLTVLASIGQ